MGVPADWTMRDNQLNFTGTTGRPTGCRFWPGRLFLCTSVLAPVCSPGLPYWYPLLAAFSTTEVVKLFRDKPKCGKRQMHEAALEPGDYTKTPTAALTAGGRQQRASEPAVNNTGVNGPNGKQKKCRQLCSELPALNSPQEILLLSPLSEE